MKAVVAIDAAMASKGGSTISPGTYTAIASKWNHFLVHNEDGL